MAACGRLQPIFENPLPENPTLLESLSSWTQIKPAIKPTIEQSSFTEIFGELHFKENSQSSSPSSFPNISPFSSTSIIGLNPQNSTFKLSMNDVFHEDNRSSSTSEFFSSTPKIIKDTSNCRKKSESFSLNSESLQLCTEGLGFESSDDVEDMKNEMKEEWESKEKKTSSINYTTKHTTTTTENLYGELRRSRASSVGAFPPPISCIGKSGKPWVCFKSYRQDGRFVLKEVRIPTQEFLHACREDGRLKLQFVQPNDEILEEEELEEEQEEEEEEEDDIEVEDLEKGLINDDDIDEGCLINNQKN
ncbi:hypothetical protein REPUB_Repub11eG0133000 [Reevesia pubescens]